MVEVKTLHGSGQSFNLVPDRCFVVDNEEVLSFEQAETPCIKGPFPSDGFITDFYRKALSQFFKLPQYRMLIQTGLFPIKRPLAAVFPQGCVEMIQALNLAMSSTSFCTEDAEL